MARFISTNIAGRIIKRIHDEKMCDGIHIMALGKEEKVPDIMTMTSKHNALGFNFNLSTFSFDPLNPIALTIP